MAKEEILLDIESRAYKYDQEYRDCSQCTLLAIQEVFHLKGEDALKAATGFAGGMGRTGSVCGALIGGVMDCRADYGKRSKNDPLKSQEGL